MEVRIWKPQEGCAACARASEMFDEHARMAMHTHALTMKQLAAKDTEIEGLRYLIAKIDQHAADGQDGSAAYAFDRLAQIRKLCGLVSNNFDAKKYLGIRQESSHD